MKGFKFAGISAGIKKNNQLDLGLIFSESESTSAALFTKNQVVAAPVIVFRDKIKSGICQAVLVNSGNANCFTGEQGIEDVKESVCLLSSELGISDELVFVSSTGVIGEPLPMDKVRASISRLVVQLSEDGCENFARSILTTDTCTKVVTEQIQIQNKNIAITGIAKGSGMIRPDMATMLAYICTDIEIAQDDLNQVLVKVNEKSFNRISVDGDTSTNDTLLALANGTSGVIVSSKKDLELFETGLSSVCTQLAEAIVKDGEGANKLVRISVSGALSAKEAYQACEAIAHSNLVKTAIYGEDPNWGRITAAAGRSGAKVDQNKMDLCFDGHFLVKKGKWLGKEAEQKAAQIMKQKTITIELNLNMGDFSDYYLFCDFSEDYVKINADYRT